MPTDLYSLIEQRPDHPNFGHPFYIGIGTIRRPRSHFAKARSEQKHPNQWLQEVFDAHFSLGIEPAVCIIDTFETIEEACVAEKRAIAKYGRIGVNVDGVLCNISAGGQGIDSETMRVSWENPDTRDNRTEGMRGVKKTTTPESTAARQATARLPRSEEARAILSATANRSWADPEFREKRVVDQTAAWEDPEKRANMLAGRSEGIAASWEDPEVRAKRTANVSTAVKDKWANDPEYAAKARAGLKAAWADPEKKAARVAKMMASRSKNPRVLSPEARARQSEVMKAVNASLTTEERSVIQSKNWSDPEKLAKRNESIKQSAQDPALKAARVANMLEGKRRKAAARAAERQVLKG